MSRFIATSLALCLGALCLPGRADIRLEGHQHIGDLQSTQFIPADPVTRARMLSYPTRFHLTQTTTITGVKFVDPVSIENQIIAVYLNGVANAGSLNGAGDEFTLNSPVTLSAGIHTIFTDGGCFGPDKSVFTNCGTAEENDFSFSALILRSAQTSNSINLTQRRTIGDDNDSNDDYEEDLTAVNPWYPDTTEGLFVDIPFTLSQSRVLSEIRFYRMRGVQSSNGQVQINGVTVGNLVGLDRVLYDPFTISPAPGVTLAAGTHTLRVDSGAISDTNRDTFSWDDLILIFGQPAGASTLGSFNVVGKGGNGLSGTIKTQISDKNVDVDIVALNLLKNGINSLYVGTVNLKLLNAADDSGTLDASGCRSSWTTLADLGNTSFGTGDGGRKSVSPKYYGATRIARFLATDTVTGNYGCSVDAFAIIPDGFNITASHATPTTPGTVEKLDNTGTGSGSKFHRAGRPFTISVEALKAPNYDGTVELEISSLIRGNGSGQLTADTWSGTGTRVSNNARYSEVATFNLRAFDSTYANIDAADTLAANRTVAATKGVGRFTPDHFRLQTQITPVFNTSCGFFIWMGQPFAYQTLPQATIQAVNVAGGRTLGYNGDLYKSPTVGASTFNAINRATLDPVALDLSGVSGNEVSIVQIGPGLVRVSYGLDNSSLIVPKVNPRSNMQLDIEHVSGAITDSDGVTYADPFVTPLKFGDASANNGIAFSAPGNRFRFGRLFVRNGYGSELEPLNMVYGVETYVGDLQGYSPINDNCTPAPATALSGDLAGVTSVSSVSTVSAGLGQIQLAAPSPVTVGNVILTIAGPSWLGRDDNGDGIFNEAASGQGTFGVFREADEQIYMRETYR